MGTVQIVRELNERGVSLRLEHGRLVAAVAKGLMTDEVRATIVAHKAALVDYLGGLARAPEERLSIVPGARADAIPLSGGQEGLLFLDTLEKGSTNYNMVAGLRIEGALDVEALRSTLERVVERQEALRIRVSRTTGAALQRAAPAAPFALAASEVAEEDVEQEVLRETEIPFDLDGGPLFRARLLKVAHDRHVLILALHHLIGDGWSLGILAHDISAIYAAGTCTAAEPLPPVEVSYLDYVDWMRGRMDGGLLNEQLAYWKSTLEGAPAVLDFGFDRRRPARRTSRGRSENISVPKETLAAIQDHARQEGTTLFMYLLASFNLLASRYSGQSDIVVGTPVANRSYAEVEPLVGFFVNTMVLRNRIDPAMTVRELLASVKSTTLSALRNADVPFPKLVEALAPERSLSHSPIFQINFGLQNAPTSELSLGDLKLVPIPFKAETTKFDLSLNAAVEDEGLVVSAEYSTDLYEAHTVRAILADYRALVEAMAGRSDAQLGQLVIQSLDARMAAFSGSAAEGAAQPEPLLAAVAGVARRHPGEIAAQQGGWTLSYAQLEARSTRLAALLAKMGIRQGDAVALAAPASPDFVVAALAVMKTGAAYLPLDPEAPAQRLEAILADAAPALVLCDGLEGSDFSIGGAEGIGALLARSEGIDPATLPPLHLQSADAAYIIYTSGSTGVPKGVIVTHGGLDNLTAYYAEVAKLCTADRVLQFTPTTFDVSVQEIFSALRTGAKLVFPPAAQVKVGEPLAAFLREQAITVATLPPSVLVSTVPEALPHLRLLVTGAESISGDIVDTWGCGRDFLYQYGPTEAAVTATAKFCLPGQDRPTIGRPLPNVRVHIVDSGFQPAPANVAGELLIGGAGVARGYLGDPEKTALSFIPDPFSSTPGARLYRTGDLARFRTGGEVEFVGRGDTQVKLRGFRIELGEVEAALRSHPAVADAVAAVALDRAGHPRLVGYIHADTPDPAALEESVREHLRGCVPQYMVPAVLVCLSDFPVGRNGKIDKQALPDPFQVEVAIEAAVLAGEDPLELQIASIFAASIGSGPVGLDDSFFEAGGDSLLAVQAVSRINEELEVELNLAEIFEFPTARELARRVAAAGEEMSQLLREVEAMTDAEATILIKAQ